MLKLRKLEMRGLARALRVGSVGRREINNYSFSYRVHPSAFERFGFGSRALCSLGREGKDAIVARGLDSSPSNLRSECVFVAGKRATETVEYVGCAIGHQQQLTKGPRTERPVADDDVDKLSLRNSSLARSPARSLRLGIQSIKIDWFPRSTHTHTR